VVLKHVCKRYKELENRKRKRSKEEKNRKGPRGALSAQLRKRPTAQPGRKTEAVS
jgi:hypothetical protein